MSFIKKTRNSEFNLKLSDILNQDIILIIIEFILEKNFHKSEYNLSFMTISKNLLEYFQESALLRRDIYPFIYYNLLPVIRNKNEDLKITCIKTSNSGELSNSNIFGFKLVDPPILEPLQLQKLIKKENILTYIPKKLIYKDFQFIPSSFNTFEECYNLMYFKGHVYIRNIIFTHRVNIEKNASIKFVNCIFENGVSISSEANVHFIKCTFYSSTHKISTVFVSNDSKIEIILCKFLKSINIKKDSHCYLYIKNPLFIKIKKTSFEEQHNSNKNTCYIKINENIFTSKPLELILIKNCSFINSTKNIKTAIKFDGYSNYSLYPQKRPRFIIGENVFINSIAVFSIYIKNQIRTKGLIILFENKWIIDIKNTKCLILKDSGDFLIKKCKLNEEYISSENCNISSNSVSLILN